jgi:hypothetical protein
VISRISMPWHPAYPVTLGRLDRRGIFSGGLGGERPRPRARGRGENPS